MATTIFFDMDGTIADLYGVENWLDYLLACDSLPYEIAKPLLKLNVLARVLNNLQRKGFKVGVISWLSKCGTPDYDNKVTRAKMDWLKKHLASVAFDEIHIVSYGTAKETFAHTENDILFDDEEKNRTNWTGKAFDVNNIIQTLRALAQSLKVFLYGGGWQIDRAALARSAAKNSIIPPASHFVK